MGVVLLMGEISDRLDKPETIETIDVTVIATVTEYATIDTYSQHSLHIQIEY